MSMRILIYLIITIFLNSCVSTPGINTNPNKQNPKEVKIENSIKEIEINIIPLNNLTDSQIEFYNKRNIQNFDNEIKKFKNVYNYKYSYTLGTSDTVNINLSDVDDLNGIYIIDQDGKIDLPFVGKVKIDNLSLDQAQQVLLNKIREYYKNPDLQITIDGYNSSKAYVVGAVKNQTTINLNQEPVKLIEAAINAGFNPSSGDKNFGTKGILRRGNQVYNINLENAFKNLDKKENFFLKKDDVIFIDRNSDAIHVFGEVNKPGIYYPNLNYNLTELISTSGLNQLTANAKKIYVIRENYNKFLSVNVFQLNIENPINLIVGRKFNIHSKDIIYIPAARIVKWNRAISLLLPQTDLFKSYNPIIQDGAKSGSSNVTE